MSTITLVANTSYSALSVANDDTIDCNGFRLTVDVQPAETGISVITPAKNGKMTVSGAYDLTTWSITAGTSSLIDGVFPAGAILGACAGGTGSNSYGVNQNNGLIIDAVGGTGQGSYGVNSNYGTVTNSTGGAGFLTLSHGINVNYGTVTNCTGGSGRAAYGVSYNYSTVYHATGGTASPDAYGIASNFGSCLRATDGNSRAINISSGDFKLVDGPNFATTIADTYSNITTIYSIGELNVSAVIPVGVTVVELGGGGGTAVHPLGGA